jgi:hypothetical protein
MLSYNLSILALIPLGGSYVSLSDLYSNEIGNLGCGLEDKNSLKLGSTFCFITISIIDSNSGSKFIDKWQLAKNTQFPCLAPSVSIFFAFSLCPFPSDIESTF